MQRYNYLNESDKLSDEELTEFYVAIFWKKSCRRVLGRKDIDLDFDQK
jgi:hypothetical protein